VDLKEIGCEDTVWIHLAQDMILSQACVNMVMNLWVL
jgi:hypothetical protein